MQQEYNNLVFSKNSVEFVTVAVQYCAFLENIENTTESDMTDKLTKLLPLLYLKATLLPETDMLQDTENEITVTEESYNYIMSQIYNIYSKDDAYLEVFMEDMKYSETPITASISENLADIYQDLKNFIAIYEQGIIENMNDALYECFENFKAYWGQKLVNVLRALHSLKYSSEFNSLEDIYNTEDLW